LGLATAVVPGPIVILLIVETLKYGWRAGAAVAAGPVLIDAFVMLPLALVVQGLLTSRSLQIIFGLAGLVFLLYLGMNMLITANRADELVSSREIAAISPAASFRRALLAQLLSPMAYAFWATVGAVMVRQAFATGGLVSAIIFPVSFWMGTLIVAGVLITLTAAGRSTLKSRAYRLIITTGGILMIGFGLYMTWRVFAMSRSTWAGQHYYLFYLNAPAFSNDCDNRDRCAFPNIGPFSFFR